MIVLVSWCWSANAYAQDTALLGVDRAAPTPEAESDAEPRPWAKGVSESARALALEQFEAGNALLDEGMFASALAAYRDAIRHWDHPGIRYNMALCLVNLEQPIEAYENLQLALRWGAAPLEKAAYRQLMTYKRLLDRRLSTLELQCVDPDATVHLDGRRALSCPGERRVVVEAGEHVVVAAKPGYLTRTQRLLASGGQTYRVQTTLMSLEEATISRRRWAVWKPWAIAGAGVAMLAIAVPLEIKASATFERYCRAYGAHCEGADCQPEQLTPELRDLRSEGRWQNRTAIALFAVGGATLTTAAALLWINRPRSERRDYAGTLTPWVGPGVGGVTGTLAF